MTDKMQLGNPETSEVAQALVKQAEGLKLAYTKVVITNNGDYVCMGEILKDIKTKMKAVNAEKKEWLDPINALSKKIRSFFDKPLAMLGEAEDAIKDGIVVFRQAEEKKRQAEEARLREIARKEEAKKQKILDEKIARAKASGKAEKAEDLKQKKEEVFVPAPVVESQVEEVKGIQTKKLWKYEITDEKQLPREYLQPNTALIGKTVRATAGVIKIAGVRIYSEDTVAAGGR